MRTLDAVLFCPLDEDLPGLLPFGSLRYFDAAARNLVGVRSVADDVADATAAWPVRAFELWGRTARMSGSEQHIASCAVAVLDHVVPELTVSRPATAPDLLVSSADERFTETVLDGEVAEYVRSMPLGGQVAFADRFLLVSELPGAPTGLRSLAERCMLLLDAVPIGAFAGRPPADSIDPLRTASR